MSLPQSLTVEFDAEEEALIREIARVRGLDEPAALLRTLVIEAYDALWDEKFEGSQPMLTQMAQQVRQQITAGEVEVFDPDNDPDTSDL